MSEITEVEQAFKITIDGVQYLMKAPVAMLKALAKLIKFIHEKTEQNKDYKVGRLSMKELKRREGSQTTEPFKININDLKKMKKKLKSMGIGYVLLPDFCKEDDYVHLMFGENDRNKVYAAFKDLQEEKIATYMKDNKVTREEAEKNVGSRFEEVTLDEYMNTELRRDFDSAIKCVDGKSVDEENPIIICDKDNVTNYIKYHSKRDTYDDGREYTQAHYELYVNDVKQRCDEFSHGEYIHNCSQNGENSSSAGESHWNNMKNEMKEKADFKDMIVFETVSDYELYKKGVIEKNPDVQIQTAVMKEKENIIDETAKEEGIDLSTPSEKVNNEILKSKYQDLYKIEKKQKLEELKEKVTTDLSNLKEETSNIAIININENIIEINKENMIIEDGKINIYYDEKDTFGSHDKQKRFNGKEIKNMVEKQNKADTIRNLSIKSNSKVETPIKKVN